MKIKFLRYIFNYIKTFIDWLWKKIKNLWNLILHFPANILTIINLLLLIFNLHLSIQNTKETQKRWEKEISQKPDLHLVADSIAVIQRDTLFVHVRIENRGTMTAKNASVNLYIPDKYEFIGEKWRFTVQDQGYKQYYYGGFDVVPFNPTPGIHSFVTNENFKFKLQLLSDLTFPINLKYFIYEDKIGAQEGKLELNLRR